jgi:hypothetical protein
LTNASEIANIEENVVFKIVNFIILSNSYYDFGNFVKTIDFTKKALEIAKSNVYLKIEFRLLQKSWTCLLPTS